MEELYRFNPFVFIIENKDNYLLRAGLEYEKKLNKERFDQLIKRIVNNEAFTIQDLLSYFSDKELVELFTHRIFLDKDIDMESIDSRNKGYFSLIHNDQYYEELKNKNIFILGAGAIGSHVAWMLAAMGIKKITILDYDLVELSNLNRQILYEDRDIGTSKVKTLKKRLNDRFPEIMIKSIEDKVKSESDLRKYIDSSYDAVIRAIDTPKEAGLWLNKVCVSLKIPYVSGGFVGHKGVIGPTYVPSKTPCLDCYKDDVELGDIISGTAGTLAPLTELVSAKIVYEVIRVISKQAVAYNGIMEIINPLDNSSEFITLDVKEKCESCLLVKRKEKILDDGKWQLVYFLGIILTPVIGILVQHQVLIEILSILFLTIILAWNTTLDKKVFENAMYGGVFLAFSNLLLTGIRFPEIFNPNQPFFFFLISLLLQILITVTLSISIFEIITFLILKVRNLSIIYEKWRERDVNIRQKSL